MSLIQDLINKVTSLTNRLNNIGENSKTNEELDLMNPINRDALVRGSVAGESEAFSIQDLFDELGSNEFVMGNVPANFKSIVIDFDAPGTTQTKMIAVINAMDNFVLQQGTLYYFNTNRIVLSNEGGIAIEGEDGLYAIVSEYFVLTQKIEPDGGGIASIGVGGTTVIDTGIRYFNTIDTRSFVPTEFDLGEIGVATIEASVDGSGPYSTPNESTILFRATRSGVESLWLYLGSAEEIGLTKPATTASDYRLFPDEENTDPPAEYQETLPYDMSVDAVIPTLKFNNHEGITSYITTPMDAVVYNFYEVKLLGKVLVKINAPTQPILQSLIGTIAGSFVPGLTYMIGSIGTTDFTLIGATSNTIGEVFVCTGAGSGTGSATEQGVQIGGNNFSANTDMYMKAIYTGFQVEFMFEDLNPSVSGLIGFSDFDVDVSDLMGFANAIALDTPIVTVTSNGTSIALNIERIGGGDIRFVFSDGVHVHDTTPPEQVVLTEGSDTSPQINYIYLLQSNKTLTASTVGFPATEHAPIATVFCQSALSLQTDGAYKVHAWTDHATGSDDMGHLAHINSWIRSRPASWISGSALSNNVGVGLFNVSVGAGIVKQLHDHTMPALSTISDPIWIVNDSVSAYKKETDLVNVLTDSLGNTMSNTRFNVVIWGSVNEAEGDCKLFLNLSSGSYTKDQDAIDDINKYNNFNIPSSFTGTGFLICRLTVRHVSASNTWSILQTEDLRGQIPSTFAGGTAGTTTEFDDNTFKIRNVLDVTKELAVDVSEVATATERKITMPDRDVHLGSIDGRLNDVAGPLGPTLDLDFDLYEGWNATLTENLTISISNGRFKVVTLDLTGAFTIAYPLNSHVVGDDYDGTILNTITIHYVSATQIMVIVTNRE